MAFGLGLTIWDRAVAATGAAVTPLDAPVLAFNDERGDSFADNVHNQPLPPFQIDLPFGAEAGYIVRLYDSPGGALRGEHELTAPEIAAEVFTMSGVTPFTDGAHANYATIDNGAESDNSNTV